MLITKVCRKCKIEKPFDELVKNKSCSHGVDALCKECNRKVARQWYENNPEQARQTRENYYQNHKKEIQQYKAQWQEKNREHYYQRHAEWREANRQRLRDQQTEKREKNRERFREYGRKWHVLNPDKKNADTRNRRARKRKAPGKHTADDILQQLKRQDNKCFWCSDSIMEGYHVDHVIALNRGGSNDPSNIVCACQNCNCTKLDRIPYLEWDPPKPLFPNEYRFDLW